MNVGTLKKLLPSHAGFKTISQLTPHRAKVFGRYKTLVVLIPSKFTDIGHFVVLTRFPKHIEYFSSYGNSPLKEAKLLGQNEQVLLNLLGKNFTYNNKMFKV